MEIIGEFTSADAENLCGLLEGAYVVQPSLDLLVRLLEVENVDVSDIDPETVDVMRGHVGNHVARCAVVGESRRADQIEALFAAPETTELRHFSHEEENQAWEWLGAREVVQKV
ncbi:STAS/SEC14 domain-containing protein [Mesorhizobium sp. CAU 1741]|uniref:STAS/SEC14 domain-containing protein n=1 Tax=Mesorhizobium sp. CAU 1741 TaxID=3140366 RepID=UPI00325C0696